MSADRERLVELHASMAEAAAADRLATALVTGFGLCEDEGFPLNEIQRIELFKAALVALVDVRAEVARQIRVSAAIQAIDPDAWAAALARELDVA